MIVILSTLSIPPQQLLVDVYCSGEPLQDQVVSSRQFQPLNPVQDPGLVCLQVSQGPRQVSRLPAVRVTQSLNRKEIRSLLNGKRLS